LAPYLRPGRNVLAVLARFYGEPTPWWMPAPCTYGLGAGCFTFEAVFPDGLLVSDQQWRAKPGEAWLTVPPAPGLSSTRPEAVDARLLPAAWHDLDFDDEHWKPAIELQVNHVGFSGDHRPPTAPYGPMTPRPIPQLRGRSRPAVVTAAAVALKSDNQSDPVDQVSADLTAAPKIARLKGQSLPFTVELADDYDAGVLILDFGEQTAGRVEIEIEAAEGTQLDAKAAEALDNEGQLQALQQHSGFRYVARGKADRFETFDPIGLRYLGISLRGRGSVTIKTAQVNERLFPRKGGPFFECSDPELNKIWHAGRRTVDLCSQDAYVDCPSREQRAWTGDAVVHTLVDLVSNLDWSLVSANLHLAASPRADGLLPIAAASDFAYANQTYSPDWSLHWIHALWNYARHSGGTETVRSLLPVAERIVQWFLPFQSDGLLTDVTGWLIIDWSAVTTKGASGALNALWGRALRDFKQLSEMVGDSGRALWAGELWVQLRKDFQRFWDPERRLYVDSIVDGDQQPPVSQHTNAAAIVARLTKGVDDRELIETVTDPDRLVQASWLVPGEPATLQGAGDMYRGISFLVEGPPDPWWDTDKHIVAAQPFFRYVVHDAVAVADRADLIPQLCRDWQRLLARSETTFSEVWFGGSHCHGWSATPTRDLLSYTVGISPATPGFGRARVAPALGDLEWVRGAVPTPHGMIRVEASADTLKIESPVEVDVIFGGLDTRVGPGTNTLSAL
ncbi:MAG: family 78 glycoside hydrolase catalytic domain, partial [Acidimicrobiales bacterium]|nr:family 78 glycoside hydrolase catalytic domain [Acidimicrobiales bacterium]